MKRTDGLNLIDTAINQQAEPQRQNERVKIHELKTWPRYFREIINGKKTFEIRKDDRGFEVGDILELQEFSPASGYTGRAIRKQVTYIAKDLTTFGLPVDVVVMSIVEPQGPKRGDG